MRSAKPLVLSAEELDELRALTRRKKTAKQIALRARVILACAEGAQNKDVAAQLGVSKQMVCRWRVRFAADRVEALYDEPRPGAPRTVRDDQIEKVIVETLEKTPRGETHWSTRSMAKHTGLSRST